MNTRLILKILLIVLVGASSAFSHGRSEEMEKLLNAKTPDWMKIGEPIKVVPATGTEKSVSFRHRSGGATNSRNRIQIPNRGLELRLDYNIDWTGNNEAGLGASLNPDGTKLIVNSGTKSRLYEISADGKFTEVEIRLPHVTYDKGPKGFITGWRWVDNKTLIGEGGITDYAGHNMVEQRIYAFHLNGGVLSRLDLSALNIKLDEGIIEVMQIGDDLNHLKISVGGKELTVQADLKSVPKIQKQEADTRTQTDNPNIPTSAEKKFVVEPTKQSNTEVPTSRSRLLLVAVILATIGFLWLMSKKRK